MHIRTILATAAVPAALAATLLGATAASASTGPNGQTGQLTGNNATSYADPFFGGVQCNETEHAKFDTVECQFTGGNPAFAPGSSGIIGWNSDFTGSGHSTGVLAYTIKQDGSGYTAKATYPNG